MKREAPGFRPGLGGGGSGSGGGGNGSGGSAAADAPRGRFCSRPPAEARATNTAAAPAAPALDHEVNNIHVKVPNHGWHYFRDLEFEVCRKAGAAFDGWTLIDAGGGVVVDLDDKGKEYYSERKVRGYVLDMPNELPNGLPFVSAAADLTVAPAAATRCCRYPPCPLPRRRRRRRRRRRHHHRHHHRPCPTALAAAAITTTAATTTTTATTSTAITPSPHRPGRRQVADPTPPPPPLPLFHQVAALTRGGLGKVVFVQRDVEYLMSRIVGRASPSLLIAHRYTFTLLVLVGGPSVEYLMHRTAGQAP